MTWGVANAFRRKDTILIILIPFLQNNCKTNLPTLKTILYNGVSFECAAVSSLIGFGQGALQFVPKRCNEVSIY